MNKNMGTADRVIRTLVAVVFGLLIVMGIVTGLVAWILGIVGVVFLATSVVSFCPLYTALKISTKAKASTN